MLNLKGSLSRILLLQQLYQLPESKYELVAKSPKLVEILSKLGVFSLSKENILNIHSKYCSEVMYSLEEIVDLIKDELISPSAKEFLNELCNKESLNKDDITKLLSRLHLEGDQQPLDLEVISNRIKSLFDRYQEAFKESKEALSSEGERLGIFHRILHAINNYVVAKRAFDKNGSEYPPNSTVDEVPEPDFTPVVVDSPSELVLDTQVELVSGVEGKVFDTIKEMGASALKSFKDSLDALLKYLSPEDLKDFGDKAIKVGDNNKKALDKMEDKTLVINSAAKEGIAKLASDSDPSGEMGKVVSSLNVASDGPRVIDALLAKVSSIVGSNKDVESKMNETKKAIADLEKSTRESTSGDEENKDVVNANKASVKEDIDKAKAAMKELRESMATTKKLLGGYIKAISGISPKIFVKPKEGDDE